MDTRVTLSGFEKWAQYDPSTAERIIQPYLDWFERALGSSITLKITHKQTHQRKHTLTARLIAERKQYSAELTGHDGWQSLAHVLEKLKNGVHHAIHA